MVKEEKRAHKEKLGRTAFCAGNLRRQWGELQVGFEFNCLLTIVINREAGPTFSSTISDDGEILITYFNLAQPDRERLMADTMKGVPKEKHEILQCPITDQHLDGDKRVSELALQLKHNDRGELIIWDWIEGCVIHERVLEEFQKREFTGYRLRPATVRFREARYQRTTES